jgi:DNA-binding response OmpR family regulator
MPNRRLNILLIDDNYEYVQRMISLISERVITNEIKVALSYEEAKTILENQIPDLVLLDIRLHRKSGIELLRFIKESKRPCRVMMVTNYTDDSYRVRCKKLGADYFFDKTHDLPMILNEIRKMETI